MPRAMSTAMTAALTSTELYPAIFFQAAFPSGTVYFWTGIGPITFMSQTWIGAGDLIGLSPIDEGSTLEARGIVVTLSALNSNWLPSIMLEFSPNVPVVIYLGLFNAGVLIDEPIVTFAGNLDSPTFDIDGSHAMLSINCENVLNEMNVATDRRYTADDQGRDYPGDLFFQFVNLIQNQNLYIGGAPVREGNL
jgi:hypothetical protein